METPDPRSIARTMVLEALEGRKVVRMGFLGGSMSPILRPGDGIRVGPLPGRLRRGDIVLYLSGDVMVAHRVLRSSPGGGDSPVVVKGDFTSGGAETLPRSRCLGLVLSREREGVAKDLRTPFHLFLGRLLALTSPWAVSIGLAFPRPLRRAAKRVLFRIFGAPPHQAERPGGQG